jgi:hypothetical protein
MLHKEEASPSQGPFVALRTDTVGQSGTLHLDSERSQCHKEQSPHSGSSSPSGIVLEECRFVEYLCLYDLPMHYSHTFPVTEEHAKLRRRRYLWQVHILCEWSHV